jgi:thiamine monophosphate kinase
MEPGEFDWIRRIVSCLGSGGSEIGDDAAVLTGPDGETWVWTIDTLVENVHFRFDWLEPEAARRASRCIGCSG